jgi:aquaporin Z
MSFLNKKLISEFLGTFFLIFVGCGTALFTMKFVGYIGVAFAFGITLMALIYAFGPVSGCHINPAVSFGMLLSGRMDVKEFLMYVIAQLVGAFAAAGLLLLVLRGMFGCEFVNSFATNGFGEFSPGGFNMTSAAIIEIVATFLLVYTVLVTSSDSKNSSFTGLAAGAALVVGHFLALPVTGASINPARSFGVALVENGEAIKQLWFFFVMPMVGGLLASLVYKLTR